MRNLLEGMGFELGPPTTRELSSASTTNYSNMLPY